MKEACSQDPLARWANRLEGCPVGIILMTSAEIIGSESDDLGGQVWDGGWIMPTGRVSVGKR